MPVNSTPPVHHQQQAAPQPTSTGPNSTTATTATVAPVQTIALPVSHINALMQLKKHGVLCKKLASALVYITCAGAFLSEVWTDICASYDPAHLPSTAVITEWHFKAARICKLHAGKGALFYGPVAEMAIYEDEAPSKEEMISFLDGLHEEGNLCTVFANKLILLLQRNNDNMASRQLVEREIYHYWKRWKPWKNIADLIAEIHHNAGAVIQLCKST